MLTRVCACVMMTACTSAAAIGGGPTLDSDGRFGVELDGTAGVGSAHILGTNAEQFPTSARIVMAGFELSFGVAQGPSRVLAAPQLFVEYLRIGPVGATGYHARVSVGAMPVGWFRDGTAIVAVTAGPIRTTAQHDHRAPDDYYYATTATWSADASVRLRLGRPSITPPARWQFALLAVARSSNITAQP